MALMELRSQPSRVIKWIQITLQQTNVSDTSTELKKLKKHECSGWFGSNTSLRHVDYNSNPPPLKDITNPRNDPSA